MCAELDRLFEPRALAARAWRLRVETPLSEWLRLATLDGLVADEAAAAVTGRTVRIDVSMREDENGAPLLEGELAVTLRCTCQRCLEEMELELRAQPRLFFGRADQLGEAAIAGGFELCEPEPGATLRHLLEDEALLSMPAFPVHGRSEDCGLLAAKLAELEPAEGGYRSSSPFAVLAELKRKN
jgi:uncharacterized protein